MKKALSSQILVLALAALCLVAAKELKYLLEYKYLNKVSTYHHYLEGTIERKGEMENIHLQFMRNSELKPGNDNKLVLTEWGEKYQGSQMDFSELGLPSPGEKIERMVDKLGRVGTVLRYLQGHRYYLGWLVFPDHAIGVGNSWKYNYPLVFDALGKSVKTKCEINYTLDKVLVYKKRNTAKILAQGICTGADPGGEVSYGFDSKIFFDIDQGREIDYQTTVTWTKANNSRNAREAAKIEIYSILEK
jgi:hypothetical protein